MESVETEKPAAAGAAPKKYARGVDAKYADLSEEARLKRALGIWESLKPDLKDELERYQTFRIDMFEDYMRKDSRGRELFLLYKPGSRDYSEFFEEHMGPWVFDFAKKKLNEGLSQVVGVIVVVVVVCAVLAFFGTDIIQAITTPFSGIAEDFTALYGF
jgi:hypothetical protein